VRRGNRGIGIAACVWATWVMGCSTLSLPDPSQAARAFAEAVRSGEAARVHAMLDEDTQRAVSVEDVAALLASNREDLAPLSTALEQRSEGVSPTARTDLGHGDEVLLVVEDGAYRIDGGAAALITLATPEEAVRALRSALRRGDLRAVLRVLSRDSRTDVETEVERVLEETEDTLDIEVQSSGDEAIVRLTGGRVLHLVREDGEWHVIDLP
jgi:hypothetical protein